MLEILFTCGVVTLIIGAVMLILAWIDKKKWLYVISAIVNFISVVAFAADITTNPHNFVWGLAPATFAILSIAIIYNDDF